MTVLAIGLAAAGIVGFSFVQGAAERKAEEIANRVATAAAEQMLASLDQGKEVNKGDYRTNDDIEKEEETI